ncbi:MAG: zf-HC2 domain-containing protein [Chloroflexi bacterium]|nr:zf-HC2 domain-containing protein [Chloroflexota bacterium]MDA1218689.1 zf-HC2 domain-containing protein [Chloroflexota bacterium]PKB57778.1 MAG: hypothetical protein BZY73_01420 [SAR202 cluster bacterium Casp-Chloro-G3]
MNRMLRRMFRRGDFDCRDTRELGSDYLEDGLAPQKRSAIQSHLDKCGPCRAFIDSLSATIGILARLPRATPPASFKQSVLDRTREEKQSH